MAYGWKKSSTTGGNGMILNDFLSRQKYDGNPHEIICISLNMQMCYRVDIITYVKKNKRNI